ncbi:phosphoglucosamine mutase [Hyphobacterium sp.]|uniref:phosphoglucosamine mutase n=1 Tax=Hyphobacterium sp. TaxID=2004662 RepID=UPI003BABC48B
MKNKKKYFGTDGIRGTVNTPPMTPTFAMQLGMAAGQYFKRRGDHRHSVVIGKDTRLSGYMIETALVSGFTAVGMDVFQFGPIPTPAVAQLTRSLRADLGVMITASHNPYYDNGIKLFGPDGFKLSDKAEMKIEALLQEPAEIMLAKPDLLGRAKRVDDAQARYVEIAKATFPRDMTLSGLRIVIDSANGAGYKVSPAAFWELGADVIEIHTKPDGFNINNNCGATDPSSLAEKVIETRADIGIAFDGDADRVVIVDEQGHVVDGDQLLAVIASEWAAAGRLRGKAVVATVMSNFMLGRFLESLGLELERADVGDRYVVEKMRELNANIGGEQSGHIVLSDFATTGDGLITALQLLAILKQKDRPVSESCRLFEPAPQRLENIAVSDRAAILSSGPVEKAIAEAQAHLGKHGRILVRASGTEPVIRVMTEGEEPASDQALEMVSAAIRQSQV